MLRGNHLCSSIIQIEFLSFSSLQSTSFLNLHQSIISLNSSIFTSFNGGEGPPHPSPSSALDMTFAKHLPCSHFFIWLKGNTVGQKIIFNNFLKTSKHSYYIHLSSISCKSLIIQSLSHTYCLCLLNGDHLVL